MTQHDPVPLPRWEPGQTDTAAVAAGVRRWVTSAPVRRLVAAFGGEAPAGEDVEKLLRWLDEFSATRWDFRRGRERHRAVEPELDRDTTALVMTSAATLGLVEPTIAPHRTYSHLLVLGGLARACLQRTGYAADLIAGGSVRVGEVAALGSFRTLGDDELALLRQWRSRPTSRSTHITAERSPASTEADAMAIGVAAAFGFATPAADERREFPAPDVNRSWSVRTFRADGQPPVRVLAAPSSEPAVRRANTADTFDFWARNVTLSPRDRVLLVTSAVYVPFQHCDAIRMLGLRHGCGIDTVGIDVRAVGQPVLRQELTAGRYLQEIRSAIRSMRALFGALTDPRASDLT